MLFLMSLNLRGEGEEFLWWFRVEDERRREWRRVLLAWVPIGFLIEWIEVRDDDTDEQMMMRER